MKIFATQDPKYSIAVDEDSAYLINTATGNRIPPDEPIFITRAKDTLALNGVLLPYLNQVAQCTPVDAPHAVAVLGRVRDFQTFIAEHPERMKFPDTVQPAAPLRQDDTNVFQAAVIRSLQGLSKSWGDCTDTATRLRAHLGIDTSSEEFAAGMSHRLGFKFVAGDFSGVTSVRGCIIRCATLALLQAMRYYCEKRDAGVFEQPYVASAAKLVLLSTKVRCCLAAAARLQLDEVTSDAEIFATANSTEAVRYIKELSQMLEGLTQRAFPERDVARLTTIDQIVGYAVGRYSDIDPPCLQTE